MRRLGQRLELKALGPGPGTDCLEGGIWKGLPAQGQTPLRVFPHPAPARPAAGGGPLPDDQILATYCHGLLDRADALAALLDWAGMSNEAGGAAAPRVDPQARREADLDRLADSLEEALDWPKLARAVPELWGTEA